LVALVSAAITFRKESRSFNLGTVLIMISEADGFISEKASLLSAMANEMRLKILLILSQRETSVGDLAEQVDLSQSALSQHLSKLRADNLVRTRKDAQTVYYSTRDKRVLAVLTTLGEVFSSDMGDLPSSAWK